MDNINEKLKIIEEKLDRILFDIDSEYIVMDIKKSSSKSLSDFGIDAKQIVATALPYVLPYTLPYIYLALKLL